MKKILFISFLFWGCNCLAQQFNYTYDLAGNRTGRSCPSCSRMMNLDAKKDSIEKNTVVKYGINVFPNPTSQNINVTISSLTNGQTATVYLFEQQGRNILTRKQSGSNDEIEMSGLSAGTYLLKVVIESSTADQTSGGQVFYRIVKL